MINYIVDQGATVIIIEHNLHVIKTPTILSTWVRKAGLRRGSNLFRDSGGGNALSLVLHGKVPGKYIEITGDKLIGKIFLLVYCHSFVLCFN